MQLAGLCAKPTAFGPCGLGQSHGGLCGDAGQIPASSRQIGGDHYRKHRIQPWDIWEAYGLDAFTGAILKYLLRDKGNRLEDLKKPRHTLDKLIESEECK